jgi:hypothetical protein
MGENNFVNALDADDPLRRLIRSVGSKVLEVKGAGGGLLPATLPPSAASFLMQNRSLLLSIMEDSVVERRLRRWIEGLSNPEDQTSRAQRLRRILGLSSGGISAESCCDEGRDFLLVQLAGFFTETWRDPLACLLSVACQVAVHRTLMTSGSKVESEITSELSSHLKGFLAREVVPAFRHSSARFLDGQSLEILTASMQGHRDFLGSDLALVVGVNVLGVPRYRAALLQAKRSEPNFKADVSEGEGAQLDELLSTGMGFYLFYPPAAAGGRFLPVVRSAEGVFRDVRESSGSGRVPILTNQNGTETASELSTFVSVAMGSRTAIPPGRLFPDARSLTVALSSGRAKPLEVVVLDQTGRLKVAELASRLADTGFECDQEPIGIDDIGLGEEAKPKG